MIFTRHSSGIADNFVMGFYHRLIEPVIVMSPQTNGKLFQFVCENFKVESINVRVLFPVRFPCLIEFAEKLPHVFSPLESHFVVHFSIARLVAR